MLDDYKDVQPIIYKTLINSLKNNRISHAYLFELNGYSKGFDVALAFAKFLMCPKCISNRNNCDNCNQCDLIDDRNFLELKIIDTDSQWIKKEQLEELQREFMTKSLISDRKVYIINNAEKLNVSASNSLLKFLEEPPNGIVAIIVVDNINQLLNTITSRCQILSFRKNIEQSNKSIEKIGKYLFNDTKQYEEFISSYGNEVINEVVDYISYFENNKEDTIIYKNKQFLQFFDDRKKIIVAFELFILYYKDVLNNLLNLNFDYFFDYFDEIDITSKKNNIKTIIYKIKILVNMQSNIKYNLNSTLLMDKLVINFCKE